MSEPFLDIVRRSWLLLSVLLLLLGMCSWSIWTQNQLIGKIAEMENTLSGKMPPKWEARLNKLEAQVADSNRWPKDANETKRFDAQVAELVIGLPYWLEVKYLPSLNLVRWAAMAFNHLNDFQNPDILLTDLAMAKDMRSLADAKPGDDASDLDQKLREKADRIENQQIAKAIKWAEQYLKNDADTQPDSTETDIASIYEFLGRHENNLAQNDPNKTRITSLRKGLESELYRTVEEQQAKAKRKYQEWALEKIRKFEDEFERVSGEGQASLAKIADALLNSSDDDGYKEIQKAMVSHLLPIDLALLDLPVLKLYYREFDRGWALLDGRAEQHRVAKSSAVTPKKPLRTVLEDES